MRQPVGIHVQIRLVDLEYIPCEHHFRTFPGAGDDGLYLVRSQVLGFVHYEIHFPQAAASYIGQRGYQKFLVIDHGIDPVCLSAAFLETTPDYVEVVHERLDEWPHFAFLVSGQESYFLISEYYCRTGQDYLVIVLFQLQGCGQCDQSLSCAGPSGERNQPDIRVQACVESEFLFIVARGNTVGAAFLDQDDAAACRVVSCASAVSPVLPGRKPDSGPFPEGGLK